jgi:hypothetical protein
MLVVGNRGEVWYHGLGDNKRFEESISKELTIGVRGIKNIHGVIYVVGSHRTVLRRDGPERWTPVSNEIHRLSKKTYEEAERLGGDFKPGFNFIDGFAQDRDLYAAGGIGDVWRYDGQRWHPVDIPLPQMQFKGVCCASDGWVYLAGRFGTLLKGREDEWKVIKHGQTESDFLDIVDYDGRVYVCTVNDLYRVTDESLEAVDFGAMDKPFSFGALYANHGKLMASGAYSACLYDGEQWTSLYGSPKAEEISELHMLNQMSGQLEEMVDKLGEAAAEIKKHKP